MLKKLWQNPWFQLASFLALTALVLWACYELRQILVPLALAFIVAYIFHPLIDWLEERKVPRVVSIALLLILLIAGIAGLLLIVVPRMVRQTADLVQTFQQSMPTVQAKTQELLSRLGGSTLAQRLYANLDTLIEAMRRNVPEILTSAEAVLSGIISRTVGLVGFIVNFLLFAVVSVYLLRDFRKITAHAEDLIPPARRESVLDIVGKIDANLKSFFRGQLLVCTILTVLYLIGLIIVGVPFALPIAIVGGYGQIVPYLGTALAILPAALIALVEYTDFWHPAGALAVFVIGQTLEGTVITPKIMGERVGLHPVVVILAILIFSQLMGFLGLLLAVPLAAALKVMVVEAYHRYKHSGLYTSQTHGEP
ncbi:MAG: AI-2E family transporter [Candidatus Abyssubacteria bacterium]